MVRFISKLWGYLTGLIVIGIIIYLILLYLTAQSLSAEIIGIDSVGYDPFTSNVKTCFTIQVNNTGLIDVSIEKLYYKVYVDDQYLGEGVRENIVIEKGSNNIDICLVAESKDIVRSLGKLIIHGGRVNVTIKGYVDIPIKSFGVIKLWTAEIPFEKTATVEIYSGKITR
jgi:LEA14-like dessication related protein